LENSFFYFLFIIYYFAESQVAFIYYIFSFGFVRYFERRKIFTADYTDFTEKIAAKIHQF